MKGGMKNRDFLPISRYTSETIQDTTIWNANRKTYEAFEWYHIFNDLE